MGRKTLQILHSLWILRSLHSLKMKQVLFLAVAFAVALAVNGKATGKQRYDGYKVISVAVKNVEQHRLISSLENNSNLGLDFWKHPSLNGEADIMVPPQGQAGLLQFLNKHALTFKVKYDDVQSLINGEKEQMAQHKALLRSAPRPSAIDWDSFYPYADIEDYVLSLPNRSSLVSVTNFGTTYENRSIYAVKISNSPNNRKAIFVDANIHAREWITSATATWIINELAVNPNNTDYSSVLDGIDIYIVPVINPDGYQFTHDEDRMWRKTRTLDRQTGCYGADPNRNFPDHFGGASTSPNPCDYQLYHGAYALSEPNTKALSDYIQQLQRNNVNIQAYISYHSYGQMWLLPWSHTAGAYPPDYAEQKSLGDAVAASIRALYGTRYDVGTPADILYPVGGGSFDYVKTLGVKYTCSPEMRGPSFVVPPSTIVPNSQEMMAALQTVAERVRSE